MRKIIFTICLMLFAAFAFSQSFNNRVAFPKDVMFRDTVYVSDGTDSFMVWVHNDTARFKCISCNAWQFVPSLPVPAIGTGTDNQLVRWNGTGVSSFQNSSITVSDVLSNICTMTMPNELKIQTTGGSGSIGNRLRLVGADNTGTNAGGSVFVTGGAAAGSTFGGSVIISGGAGSSTSHGGGISISSGSATGSSGDGGSVTIACGSSTNGTGGSLHFAAGTGGAGNGTISLVNSNSFEAILNVSSLTSLRTFTFPDATGTIALLETALLNGDASAIPSYPDNATAVGAIGAGKLYYTNVSGEHIVKITY